MKKLKIFFRSLELSLFRTKGFTLIEILVVIGIIAVLSSIVIVAINPAKQFAQARNTQRTSNIESILNAIGQRMADNKGVFEGDFTISSNNFTCGKIPNGFASDISFAMASNTTAETGKLGCLVPTYISALPEEPIASGLSYTIELLNNGRVQICAPEAVHENSIPNAATICMIR